MILNEHNSSINNKLILSDIQYCLILQYFKQSQLTSPFKHSGVSYAFLNETQILNESNLIKKLYLKHQSCNIVVHATCVFFSATVVNTDFHIDLF